MEKSVGFVKRFWTNFLFLMVGFLATGNLFGQAKVDVDINKGGGAGWFGSWYFWVGIAVFIIIIVALVSSGRRRA